MSEKESPARQTQGPRVALDENPVPQFEIENLRRVEYGRVRWRFDLIAGPIIVECQIVADENGSPKFAAPAAVKESYTQTYRSTVTIKREFMHEVFHAVAARIGADRKEVESEAAAPPSSWAEDQEARFERVVDEFEGAA